MKITHPPRRYRPGFTLIELLVVMAIIGILMSLLLAAVFKVLLKSDEVTTRNEITQLASAVQAFQTKYGVQYVPSAIALCDNVSAYYKNGDPNQGFQNQLYQDSFQYLMKIWPRLQWNGMIRWSGIAPLSSPVVLEGEQCLVFFTGGISVQDSSSHRGVNGFNVNPYNPTQAGGERVSFFDYQPSRLVPAGGSAPGGFWAYQDPYQKKAYAYFSSYKTSNDYNHVSKITNRSDCASLGVSPYAEVWNGATSTNNKYVNPSTFQIISAGKDATFGPGTTSTATQYIPGITSLPSNAAGYDDMSNFYDKLMGISR
jgi:prepilin-type N-terminal cleavage/methylation domain-containing protein